MNCNLRIILTATTASLLTLAALGQDENSPKPGRPALSRDRVKSNVPHDDRLNSAAKASEVIGMAVKNYQGETLGRVEDFAVDMESGRIVQVILSTGGFVGVGERLSAVPPGALHHDAKQKVLHLDANPAKLKSAPEFSTSKWQENSDYDHLSAVYTHYNQEPALKFVNKGDPADGTADTTSSRNPDENRDRARATAGNAWMIPAARLNHLQRASQLMGLNVKNQQDEKLGKVDNLLVDVESGRVIAVVISSGGFLGLGDELSAVPPTALSFNTERDALQLDASKELLAAAPHFKSDQWPDFNQPAYPDSVYRAYKAVPYFSTNTVTDADNSGRNVRDRNNGTLTPLDQGNSKADTDTTARIRKAVIAGKDLSVNARNVKIITNNGRVTLRGPVKNADEKRVIGEMADRVAQPENVDNQLEVSLRTTGN